MHERYSIEVNDETVVIYGDLTIEETFDFLNFFDKKGYKSISGGFDNSTIYMSRKIIEKKEEVFRQEEHVSSEKSYEILYDKEKKSHEKTKTRADQLHSLVRTLINGNIGFKPIETDITGKYFQCTYPKMEPIPNCCSTPERQEQYEELVRLKNACPHIPVPSPSDYYINPDPTKE